MCHDKIDDLSVHLLHLISGIRYRDLTGETTEQRKILPANVMWVEWKVRHSLSQKSLNNLTKRKKNEIESFVWFFVRPSVPKRVSTSTLRYYKGTGKWTVSCCFQDNIENWIVWFDTFALCDDCFLLFRVFLERASVVIGKIKSCKSLRFFYFKCLLKFFLQYMQISAKFKYLLLLRVR